MTPREGFGAGLRRLHRAGPVAAVGLMGLTLAYGGASLAMGAGGGVSTRGVRVSAREGILTCATRHARFGFRAGPVRLFTLGRQRGEYRSSGTTRLVGCLKPRGPVWRLGFLSRRGDTNVGSVESPRAAAPYVAYAIQSSDEIAGKYGFATPSTITVHSVNLITGTEIALASFVQQPGEQSVREAAVPNLQLAVTGWIAWVLSSASGEAVYAYDARGLRTLDTGKIEPGSLLISGATITWTNAGAQRSAPLYN